MQLITPAEAAGRVTAALKDAAAATGAGFDYLLRTARRESSLDPTAKAPTSSARGLFQFIDQTWLEVLKQDGAKLGLGDAAADVTRSASGRYVVADPERRAEILAMRDDPTASALLAGAFTRRNAATVEAAVGRPATEGELYAAHFLGAQGAVDLITLAATKPDAPAAGAFPAQASANRAIFYDKSRARSAAEVYAKLTRAPSSPNDASLSTPPAPVAVAYRATATEDYGPFNSGVENDGAAFHSLFKTGRRQAVSAYVAQAWSSFGSAGLASDVTAVPARKVARAPAQPAAAIMASAQAIQPVALVRTVRTERIAGAAGVATAATQPVALVRTVRTERIAAQPSQADASASHASRRKASAESAPVMLPDFRAAQLATPMPSRPAIRTGPK
ncbi:lytic transglycosylase domain-containing protein [Hansschlegelia sp. KR7-227]|uniref:lytic transglycosylase domain-containing protein n=1 Tax=Hansschlegelia sp. KR7-227 TaxID=3400914 RepID=UPI003C0435A9